MAVPEAFRALVEKYEFQRPTISPSQYNETQLRREFVDKFFADVESHCRMVALVSQMLESISDLKARNGFREELIRVLRLLNNSGLLPIRAKTALRRNRPISSRKLQDAKLDHDKTLLQRQVEATDAAIDKLVYELYGLTEEEIKIVEGNSNT